MGGSINFVYIFREFCLAADVVTLKIGFRRHSYMCMNTCESVNNLYSHAFVICDMRAGYELINNMITSS